MYGMTRFDQAIAGVFADLDGDGVDEFVLLRAGGVRSISSVPDTGSTSVGSTRRGCPPLGRRSRRSWPWVGDGRGSLQ